MPKTNILMFRKFLLLITIISIQQIQAQIHIGPGQTYNNIQAASVVVKPGDTVFVHAGSYTGYQGIIGLKGTAAKPIVIMRYKNDLHDISGCWQFQACEHLTFRYLNFKANSTATGRLINMDNNGSCTTQAKYIIFDSCYFSNVTDANSITAFKFGGVDFFEVTNCVFKDIPNCNAFDFNVCHHGLIKGNYLENCQSAGHIKGGASDITMERNTFINASSGNWVVFEFGGDTGPQFYCPNDTFEVRNLRFYSNLIVGCGRGFALSSARDCDVINNTFYNCSGTTFRLLNTSNLYPKLYNNRVENNIFAFGTTAYMNASAQQAGSTYFSNNIYYSLVNANFTGPYWDTPEADLVKESSMRVYGNDTFMFVDTAKKDFHLAMGSPAIAAGKQVAEPSVDVFGYVYKNQRSIGAAEYNSTSNILVPQQNEKYYIYPNPTNTGSIILQSNETTYTHLKAIQIFSATGELVYSQSSFQMLVSIDTKRFSKGLYIVRIAENDFISTQKLIVE
ncbi:MAG: T9SS type A sorting domain-containing protein [Bacteroidota bacterium]|nr:T9SS type A sorting domain-containing protein [Bacteroidota bacterium]